MSRTYRRGSVVLAVVAVLAIPAAVWASHSWGNYHWARTSNPFTLKLGDNLSSTWDPHLVTASNDWSMSSVLNTTIVAGGSKGRNCKATSGRVEVCNAAYGNNGWLGIAQIWASGSHITQGVVKVNDTYFNSAPYNTSAWRNLVMCQEVGHTFGLDHQDENFDNPPLGTCMDYSNDPNPNQHPNSHDYQQLEIIYSHLDSTTTVGLTAGGSGKMPPAMTETDFAGPGQWGRLVGQARGGRAEAYMADFGNGFRVFTFVIWAD